LSHNQAIDPVLNYGNQRVLDLWEVDWAELVEMHSRATAKPVDQSARSTIMEHVKKHNYMSGYSGVRVSKTGKEFKILDGTIWNVFTSNGDFYGQAAWFRSIERLAGI
jgi:MEKHLA domain